MCVRKRIEYRNRQSGEIGLVARDAGPLMGVADDLQRYVESQFPDSVRFERGLVRADEVLGE